ncbi:MAG TPA: adenylate/guanylate cyclase domain-containing protein, partial [Candidatus Dormibacteraeota bacterium]|nr:adenylate/guanylate cyclase domain-containing protein [Candidatus Dormibacteraeota bacterium]
MGRYVRYWYTYRTAVAVLMALVLTGAMFWLYTQQLTCDARQEGCLVNLSVHPEDRFAPQYDPGKPQDSVVIVGIDDESLKTLHHYPISRDKYATALHVLEKDGASAVAFDIGFPDKGDGDAAFHDALVATKLPVVMAYGAGGLEVGAGKMVQGGIDEIPIKAFRCVDTADPVDGPCQQALPNVVLASTDLSLDQDGVLRRIPLAVQPVCYARHTCSTPVIDTIGAAAYRLGQFGASFQTAPDVAVDGGRASFGTAWSTPVDGSGSILINFSGPPGNFEQYSHYVSFSKLIDGTVSPDFLKDKIVLIGAYNLTGVNDAQLVPTSFSLQRTQAMNGVEIHANVVQMLLNAVALPPNSSRFLVAEPPWVLLVILLVLGLATAVGVARVTVLWGLLGTVVALVLFTFGMSALSTFQNWVPDLFHPWLAIALTYSGVTAYRFLYEDREKRKVTNLFGHYLKPEIVAELAKTRGGADDILRGGERRDITLMFVDIRGFTSMSESMAASDVTEVVQMYLDHLSGIIFTWDGTVDKYVGDEIMAFWNAPRNQGNHALLAVRCAYDCINHAPELQQKLLAKGLPPIRWGIGINTGPAVVGNMGSRSRLQYTALGDTVNTAARFCAHAPAFQALIGQMTYEMCRDYIAVDLVPGVQLKGKSAETFSIYEVTAIRQTPDSPWVQFPSQMATQSHHAFTAQYTQATVIAAAETGSTDLLIGEEAEELLARQ